MLKYFPDQWTPLVLENFNESQNFYIVYLIFLGIFNFSLI